MQIFPVPRWIDTYNFEAQPRSFRANRAAGRKHAGCDLYAPLGSDVLAVADGKIIRCAPFYWGTWAIEVEHPGIGIIRYGEILVAAGMASGMAVQGGRKIGSIAQLVNPNPNGSNPHPMLHFELYAGTGSGPLSTADEPFKRRTDLLDPTEFLKSLVGACS